MQKNSHTLHTFSAQEQPMYLGNDLLNVSFSKSKRIMDRGSDRFNSRDATDDDFDSSESNVLLFTVFNVPFHLCVDTFHRIISPIAKISRIVIFRKTPFQVSVCERVCE